MDKGQFLLYQTPDGDSHIEVKLQNDTVWLSLDQMAELFQRNKSTISRHVKNVLEDGELEEKSVVAFFATTASDSKTYSVAYYNLDMIISVGYRVHSYRGVQFRIWATKVLKEYIVKGFAMNDDLLKRAGGDHSIGATDNRLAERGNGLENLTHLRRTHVVRINENGKSLHISLLHNSSNHALFRLSNSRTFFARHPPQTKGCQGRMSRTTFTT